MSAGQRYSRLCIVPPEDTTVDGQTGIRPMFAGDTDIDATCGGVYPRSYFEDFFAGYLANNTGYDKFFICRFYATGSAGYQKLNAMATTWECLVLAEHEHNIGDVMATFFPDDPRDASEWANVFQADYR